MRANKKNKKNPNKPTQQKKQNQKRTGKELSEVEVGDLPGNGWRLT